MEVRSWYAETEISLDQDWSFEFLGTIDAWSGATPNGLAPTHSSSTLPWLENVPEEIRKAGLFTLRKRTQHHDHDDTVDDVQTKYFPIGRRRYHLDATSVQS